MPCQQAKEETSEAKSEEVWEQTSLINAEPSGQKIYSAFVSKKENVFFRRAVERGDRQKALEYVERDETINDQILILQCIENKWDDVLLIVFKKNPELSLYANLFMKQIEEAKIKNPELEQLLQEMKERIPLPEKLKE